ncbi:MAG TPA: ZIP family metal transporter [Armatimonadetes bacterium]|nr:ZIP family metal transporter [Armatimonadota bacterium]
MTIWWYTLGSTFLISLIALVGILSLYLSADRVREWLLPMVGFAAGALLGNVFLHLLPELVERKGSFDPVSSLLVLLGIVVFFLMEQGIRHWQAEHTDRGDHMEHLAHLRPRPLDLEQGAGSLLTARPYAAVSLGSDLLHNFIDGLVVGGAFLFSIPLGISTALVVALHEVPQELGDYAILVHAGLDRMRALFYNFVTALTAVAGGVVALLIGAARETFPLYLIPFTAGTFIYLAVGSLIPELHSHGEKHRTFRGVVGMLAGIGVMVVMHFAAHSAGH